VSRDRPVVDDPPAARILVFHHSERFLRAEKRGGQVDVDDPTPNFDRQILEWDRGRSRPGVVKKQIKTPEGLPRRLKERSDRMRICHVGRNGESPDGIRRRVFNGLGESLVAAARQHNRVPLTE
jgi:hypothetical protein